MSDEIREITKRAEFSRSRLELIRDRITKLDVLSELPRLCIYVTGSFGRLEASEHSDLDVFFIHEGSCVRDAVPRIRKTLLDADLIRAAQWRRARCSSGSEIRITGKMRLQEGTPLDLRFTNFCVMR